MKTSLKIKLAITFFLMTLLINRASATLINEHNEKLYVIKPIYPDLINWLTNNQSIILSRSSFFESNATPAKEDEIIKRMLIDPALAAKAWNEVMTKMARANASSSVIQQAKLYGATLNNANFSTNDRRTLSTIIDRVNGMTDLNQVQTIVAEEVKKGNLSKEIGGRMMSNLRVGEPLSANGVRSNFHFAAVVNDNNSSVMPVCCMAAYCVPIVGILAYAIKRCRS